MRRTILRAAGLAVAALIWGPVAAQSALPRVSLEQARADHEAGRVTLIDLREPSEHATGVAKGAQLLPLSQLARRAGEIPRNPDKPVYLICNTQNRSQAALKALQEQGWKRLHYVHGGMSAWAARGWPMVKP